MALELFAAVALVVPDEAVDDDTSGSWDYAPEPNAPVLTEDTDIAEPTTENLVPETERVEPDTQAVADRTTTVTEPTPVEPRDDAPSSVSIPVSDPIAVAPDPEADHPQIAPMPVREPIVAAADPVPSDAGTTAALQRTTSTQPAPNGMRDGTATSRVAPLTGDERRALERLRARFDRRLGTRIDRSVRWPRHLLTAEVEGVVVVGFRFDEAGHVVEVVVVESSGHEALDQAALDQIAALRLPEWDPSLAAIDDRYREVPLHFDPTG
jgi:protein TonB